MAALSGWDIREYVALGCYAFVFLLLFVAHFLPWWRGGTVPNTCIAVKIGLWRLCSDVPTTADLNSCQSTCVSSTSASNDSRYSASQAMSIICMLLAVVAGVCIIVARIARPVALLGAVVAGGLAVIFLIVCWGVWPGLTQGQKGLHAGFALAIIAWVADLVGTLAITHFYFFQQRHWQNRGQQEEEEEEGYEDYDIEASDRYE